MINHVCTYCGVSLYKRGVHNTGKKKKMKMTQTSLLLHTPATYPISHTEVNPFPVCAVTHKLGEGFLVVLLEYVAIAMHTTNTFKQKRHPKFKPSQDDVILLFPCLPQPISLYFLSRTKLKMKQVKEQTARQRRIYRAFTATSVQYLYLRNVLYFPMVLLKKNYGKTCNGCSPVGTHNEILNW